MPRIQRYGIRRMNPLNVAIDSDLVAQANAPNSPLPARMYRVLAPRSPMGLIANINGAVDLTKAGMKLQEEGNSKMLYSYGVIDDTDAPLRVVDNSRVPDKVKPGVAFTVTLDEGWVQPPGVFRSKDERVEFLVVAKQDAQSDGTADYTLQLVGSDMGQEVSIVRLFERGAPMNYAGNAHGELSSTGQHFRSGSMSEYYLTGQVMRHSLPMSGHGISTEAPGMLFYYEQLDNGKERFLPIPASRTVLMKHLAHLNDAIVNGRGNYDVKNRAFLNKMKGQGARADRPKLSGMIEQFEGSTMPAYPVNPLEPNAAENLRLTIRTAVSYHKRFYGLPNDTAYGLFTRTSGYDFVQDAFRAEFAAQNGQVHSTPSTEGLIQAGVLYESLRLPGGVVYPINLDSGILRGHEYDQIFWQGGLHNVRDFNMYLVPLGNIPELDNRPLIRLMPKIWGDVNRGLVCGTINGLTGLGNGIKGSLMSFLEKSEANMKSLLSQYSLSTPVDGAEFHVLSDLLLAVEMPDLVIPFYCTATAQF